MKLTKGRIHKLLKARKQSFKSPSHPHHAKHCEASYSKSHNFTVRSHKKHTSLHNKTISTSTFEKSGAKS